MKDKDRTHVRTSGILWAVCTVGVIFAFYMLSGYAVFCYDGDSAVSVKEVWYFSVRGLWDSDIAFENWLELIVVTAICVLVGWLIQALIVMGLKSVCSARLGKHGELPAA